MLHGYQWPEYLLLVSFRVGNQNYSYLLDGVTQEQFFEKITNEVSLMPAGLSYVILDDASFGLLQDAHRRAGTLLEGD